MRLTIIVGGAIENEAADVTVAPVRSSPMPAVTTEIAAGSVRMARFRASASTPDAGTGGLAIMRREGSGGRACRAAAMANGWSVALRRIADPAPVFNASSETRTVAARGGRQRRRSGLLIVR